MPSISRRKLLAGGAALGGGAAGVTLLPASLLPDAVATWRTAYRTVPEVSARPPVTDDHEAAAREALRSTIDRAERDWRRAEGEETDDLPELVDPERSLRSARSHLDDAESDSGWDALFAARMGSQFAGKAIGGARLLLGEASGETLAEQAREIQGAVADERDRLAYEAPDPSVGVARLYFVEKWLRIALLDSHRNGVYAGQDRPTTEYDDHDVVRTWGSHLQARRGRADAARLYDDYRRGADGGWRDLTDHVSRADERLLAAARDRTIEYEEYERRIDETGSLPEGPYRTYRQELARYRYHAEVRTPGGLSTGLPVYRAVENAGAVLRGLAAEDAGPNDALSADDDRVPAGALDRTKREGVSLLRDRLDAAADRPTLKLLLREPRRLLRAGDSRLDDSGDLDHPRARAYARYRLAVGHRRRGEAVARVLDRPDDASTPFASGS
jgi:hypothetical protein